MLFKVKNELILSDWSQRCATRRSAHDWNEPAFAILEHARADGGAAQPATARKLPRLSQVSQLLSEPGNNRPKPHRRAAAHELCALARAPDEVVEQRASF